MGVQTIQEHVRVHDNMGQFILSSTLAKTRRTSLQA